MHPDYGLDSALTAMSGWLASIYLDRGQRFLCAYAENGFHFCQLGGMLLTEGVTIGDHYGLLAAEPPITEDLDPLNEEPFRSKIAALASAALVRERTVGRTNVLVVRAQNNGTATLQVRTAEVNQAAVENNDPRHVRRYWNGELESATSVIGAYTDAEFFAHVLGININRYP